MDFQDTTLGQPELHCTVLLLRLLHCLRASSWTYRPYWLRQARMQVRTEAYRCALEGNPSLIKGANVLDVGCGSAILSMFAARGGAATVVGMPDLHLPPVHHCSYSMLCQLFNMLMARWCQGCLPSSQVLWAGPCAGVDGSEKIAKYARANCSVNGLGSDAGGPVTILTGRVETVEELPLPEDAGGKVDVLVSEWMGRSCMRSWLGVRGLMTCLPWVDAQLMCWSHEWVTNLQGLLNPGTIPGNKLITGCVNSVSLSTAWATRDI